MSERVEMDGGRIVLYQGDALAVLPSLASGSVDAVVADPPFGIGFKYAAHDDTSEGYGAWLWSVLSECERCLKPGGPVFVWQAMPNVRHFAEWFPRDYRIFAAAKNFVQMRPTPMQYAWDPVVVWWKEGGKPYTTGNGNRDFHVADTASRVSNKRNIERRHPCPRPLDQVSLVVEQWCPPNGVVLDPFLGSGTTPLACYRADRRFIGCEIDPDYFCIACQRLEKATSDGPLFAQRTLPEASA